MSGPVSNFDLELYMDAGSTGFGAFFQGKWSVGPWPDSWKVAGLLKNMVLLELFPLVLAVEYFGESFRNLKVRFHGDNPGVVQVINKLLVTFPPVVRLLRHLVLRCMQLNVFVYDVHRPGVENVIADALSRFHWDKFQELAPAAEMHGVPCPPGLWKIVLGGSPARSDDQ